MLALRFSHCLMRIAKVDIAAQVDGCVQGTACLPGQRRGFIAARDSQDDGSDSRPGRSAAHGKGDPPSSRSNRVPEEAIANKELSLSQLPLSCAPYA